MRRWLAVPLLAAVLLAACSDDETPAQAGVERHGALLDHERVDDVPGARVHRVLYRSRSIAGDPIAVSGLVVVPSTPGPHPVLTFGHVTAGIADRCAPSNELVPPQVAAFVERGWVVTATDYEGLGTPGRHPYLVGVSEGRGVLDIVRAAAELPGVELDRRTLIWGHSQGGHAALFAGQLAPSWTPELDVVGTVAGAPPAELGELLEHLKEGRHRGYLALAAAGLAAGHPEADLDDVLTEDARRRLDDIVDVDCIGAFEDTFADVPADRLLTSDPAEVPGWRDALRANDPGRQVLGSPLLLIHGELDELIPPRLSATLFERLCRLGQVVERRTYEGDHAGVLVPSFPDMLEWMDDRMAGRPATSGCP